MTAASNYLENELLDHVLGGPTRAYPAPAQVFVALHTANPTDAASGFEVVGGGYARQAATFAAAAGGATANSANIAFAGMPAVTVTHVSIWDQAAAGNMLLHGALTAPVVVGSGDTFVIAAGDLDVTLD